MNILSKQQSDMIDMILEGHTMTEIAKVIGVHRSTLYVWKDLDFVRAELDERRRQLRKSASDKITGQVNFLADEMLKLAKESSDQRVKYNAIKYLLDRSLGIPTATKEDVNTSGDNDKDKDTNTLKRDLEEIKKLTVVK